MPVALPGWTRYWCDRDSVHLPTVFTLIRGLDLTLASGQCRHFVTALAFETYLHGGHSERLSIY